MATGRGHRPLFDLLGGASSRPRTPSATRTVTAEPSVATFEIKPRPTPSASPGSPGLGFWTRMRIRWRPLLGDATMSLPANAVLFTLALGIVALVGAFMWGVARGRTEAEKKYAAFTRSDALPISDPLVAPPPATPEKSKPTGNAGVMDPALSKSSPASGVPSPTPAQAAANKPATPATSTGSPPDSRSVLSLKGWLPVDPREKGMNYMYLGIVGRSEAERAIKFLADARIEALAVPWPLEGRRSGGNNPGPAEATYRLVVRQGISSEAFNQNLTARQNLQNAMYRLGPIWKKDNRGTVDFAKFSWEFLLAPR